ncbi:hypothetical protein Q5752_004369 [Cryptotrichosporon argae]
MPHPFRQRPSPPHFQQQRQQSARKPAPAPTRTASSRDSDGDADDEPIEIVLGADRRRRGRRGQRRDVSAGAEGRSEVIHMRYTASPTPSSTSDLNVPSSPSPTPSSLDIAHPAATAPTTPPRQLLPYIATPGVGIGLGRRRGVEAVMRHLKPDPRGASATRQAEVHGEEPITMLDVPPPRVSSLLTPTAHSFASRTSSTSTPQPTPVAVNQTFYFAPAIERLPSAPDAASNPPTHEQRIVCAPFEDVETSRKAHIVPLAPITPHHFDAAPLRLVKPVAPPITAFPRHNQPTERDYYLQRRSSTIGRMLPISSTDLPVTKPFPTSPPPYTDADVPLPEPYNAGFPHPVTAYTSPGVNPHAVERSGYLPLLYDLMEKDPKAMTGTLIAELGRDDLTAPALTLEPGSKDGCGIPEKLWLRLSTWAGVKIPIGTVIPFARSPYPRPSPSLAPRFMSHSPSLPIDAIFPHTPSTGSLDPPTPYRATYPLPSDNGLGPAPAHVLRHAYSAAELNRSVSPAAAMLATLSRRRSERELHAVAERLEKGHDFDAYPDINNKYRMLAQEYSYASREQPRLCPDYVQHGFCRYPQLCRYDHCERALRYEDALMFSRQQAAYDTNPSSAVPTTPVTPTSTRYSRTSSASLALSTVKEAEDDMLMTHLSGLSPVEPIGSERLRARLSTSRLRTAPSASDLRASQVSDGRTSAHSSPIAVRTSSTALETTDGARTSHWSTGSSSRLSSVTTASVGSHPASSHASAGSSPHDHDMDSTIAQTASMGQPSTIGLGFTPFSPPGSVTPLPRDYAYEQRPFTPPQSPNASPLRTLPSHNDTESAWSVEPAQVALDFSRGKSIWC